MTNMNKQCIALVALTDGVIRKVTQPYIPLVRLPNIPRGHTCDQ